MKILSRSFPGSLQLCPECQALLAFTPADIYDNKYIYCPLCRTKIETNMDLSYNPEIKNDSTVKV